MQASDPYSQYLYNNKVMVEKNRCLPIDVNQNVNEMTSQKLSNRVEISIKMLIYFPFLYLIKWWLQFTALYWIFPKVYLVAYWDLINYSSIFFLSLVYFFVSFYLSLITPLHSCNSKARIGISKYRVHLLLSTFDAELLNGQNNFVNELLPIIKFELKFKYKENIR